MSVYRFKVYFEDDASVSREIEIKSSQTFKDFHKIIQQAIDFDSLHPASFFISNDSWHKGKEIILLRKSHTIGLKGMWMHETKIAQCVDDPHQKFIYEFDSENSPWILHAELMKIVPDAAVTYPRIGKTTGKAPSQYNIPAPVMSAAEAEEEAELADDTEDAYIHPEMVVPDHYHANGNEEEPAMTVKTPGPDGEFKEEGEDDGEDDSVEREEEEEDISNS